MLFLRDCAGFQNDTDAEYLIEQLLEKGYEGDIELSEDTPNDKVDTVGIAMPRTLFTDNQLENIRRLTKAKASLIKKAMGTDDQPILDDGEKVSFQRTQRKQTASVPRFAIWLRRRMKSLLKK